MEKLREGVRELEADGYVDPGELSSLIDRLQAVLCRALNEGRKRGDHLVTGQSPCAWAASLCRLSPQSATDRLRVGAQMQNLPRIAEALSSGEIGYQSAALLCHLSDQLGEKLCDGWSGGSQLDRSLRRTTTTWEKSSLYGTPSTMRQPG